MTNTINNVPRELLERAWRALANSATGREIGAYLDADPCAPECAETCARASMCSTCSATLSATSPAGGDGLEVYITDCATCIDVVPAKTISDAKVVLAKDAHAIIGELEGLLLRVQVSLSLDDTEWGYSGAEKYKLLADIRAALSAGKEG